MPKSEYVRYYDSVKEKEKAALAKEAEVLDEDAIGKELINDLKGVVFHLSKIVITLDRAMAEDAEFMQSSKDDELTPGMDAVRKPIQIWSADPDIPEQVLHALRDTIFRYEIATLEDYHNFLRLYDDIFIPTDITNHKYGWIDLSAAVILHEKYSHCLYLPPAIRIN